MGRIVAALVAVLAAIGVEHIAPLAIGAPADWPEARGPERDGTSTETGLPTTWSPAGENLAWKAPYGGRSAPIVIGDRLYVQNPSGANETRQERVMSLDANTGKVIWEHKYSLYLSDVPMHRVAWASPAGDPATGNIYVMLGNGRLIALTRDGKQLWERSLNEEFGVITTHGGRMAAPLLDGDLVIVCALHAPWADLTRPTNRWVAIDKRTGQTVWISSPQQRHYDTNYAPGNAMTVNGMRLLVWPGTDGVTYAFKAHTGEVVWKYEFSKRALNTGVVTKASTVFVNHSEENLDTSEMGLIGAVDATMAGTITKDKLKWVTHGFQGGYSSPVIGGDILYQVDNGAVLGAFDLATGAQLWDHHLGTLAKASAVFADGKLYVGTENGKFFILQPSRAGVKVLDEDQLGTADAPEPVLAGVAVSGGKVFLVTTDMLYAIGKGKTAAAPRSTAAAGTAPAAAGEPAYLQIVPAEATIAPGATARLHARLFDAKGNFIRADQPSWTVDKLTATVAADGTVTAAGGGDGQWGQVKATIGSLSGSAYVRVIPPLPWSLDFESMPDGRWPAHWVNAATGKFELRDVEGSKVLARLEDNTVGRRTRVGMGMPDWSNYTIEADVRSTTRRRQQGDIGLINQRYALVLFGNAQKIELQPWQPATPMTVHAPFAWKPDTWYHMKLRVENLQDGTARVQGKVWPRGEAEPTAWTVEKVDKIPHRQGSPGLYADASTDLFFDNISVKKN